MADAKHHQKKSRRSRTRGRGGIASVRRERLPIDETAAEHRFLLTCAAGFEEVVAAAVRADVTQARITEVDSGLLIVEVDASRSVVGRLAQLDYLTGVHQVVLEEKVGSARPDACLERFDRVLRAGRAVPPALTRRTFRLRVIEEGQPLKVDGQRRDALERSIQRWSGMRPERRGGGAEVWVYRRRDDPRAWLSLRLDRPARRRSPAGSLKLEVAAALVRVAPIRTDDLFLDPFAGSGAISAARARRPHARLVVSDIDPARARELNTRAADGAFGPHAEVHQCDVRDLVPAVVAPATVDVAVLDPPWGSFDQAFGRDELVDLYGAMIGMLDTALSERGHAVLLVADKELLVDAIGRARDLSVIASISTLVNGKKTCVIHLCRGRMLHGG